MSNGHLTFILSRPATQQQCHNISNIVTTQGIRMEGSSWDHYEPHSSQSRYDQCWSVTLSQSTRTICPSMALCPLTLTYLISDGVWYRTGRSRINGSPALPKMKWSSPVTMKITPALMDLWCHFPPHSLVRMWTPSPLIGREPNNMTNEGYFLCFCFSQIWSPQVSSSPWCSKSKSLELAKRWTHCGGSGARIASYIINLSPCIYIGRGQ